MKTKLKSFGIKSLAAILSILMVLTGFPLSVFAIDFESDSSSTEISSAEPTHNRISEAFEVEELREESVKHFRLEDGSYMAAQYDVPVHYLDGDGKWQDIDNSLAEGGSEYSTRNAKVKFSKKVTGNGSLFTLHDGNRKITLSLDGARKKTVGTVTNTNAEFDESATKLQKMMTLDKLSSKILYADILDGIDLEYVVETGHIKENITIKEKSSDYSYTFTVQLNNLTAELTQDGSVHICDPDSDELVYIIPKGFMVDANGAYSDAVTYSITDNGNGTYTMTVMANSSWINDCERAFPITIDPTIEYDNYDYSSVVESTYVSSVVTSANYSNSTTLLVGQASSSGTYETYVRMKTLPTLPQNAAITKAYLTMMVTNVTGGCVYVNAYRITALWNANSLTYANRPAYNSTPIDYERIGGTTSFEWDITTLVSQWMSSKYANYGVLLSISGSDGASPLVTFKSERSSAFWPSFVITYKDTKGIEPYYSFYSSSADLAGSGSVNSFTGNLCFMHSSLSTTDEILPYTVSLAYNSCLYDQYYTSAGHVITPMTSSSLGKGFKASYDETIKHIQLDNGDEYYVWADADGTEHYFSLCSFTWVNADTQGFCDEDGLGLYLDEEYAGNNYDTAVGYILSDDTGNKKHFDTSGYLDYVEDANGNIRKFIRNTAHKVTSVSLKPYNSSEFTQLTMTYSSAGNLIRIGNVQTGLIADIYYSSTYNGTVSQGVSGYLRKIVYTYATGYTYMVTYEYDSAGRLYIVKDLKTGMAMVYTYSAGKVTAVKQYANATESSTVSNMIAGQEARISYGTLYSCYRTAGSDRVFNTSDDIRSYYRFDHTGRVISSYTSDNDFLYGSANCAYEDDSSVKKKNSISSVMQIGGMTTNYLNNPGFEESNDDARPLQWICTGDVSVMTANLNAFNDSYLSMHIEHSSETAKASQTFKLPTGTYTASAQFTRSSLSDNSRARMVVYNSSGTIVARSEDVFNFETEYSYSDVPEQKSVTFTVTDTDCYTNGWNLAIEFDFIGTVATSDDSWIDVDSVMLEKSAGASRFSALGNGGLESLNTSNNPVGWTMQNAASSTLPFDGRRGIRVTGNPKNTAYAYTTVLMDPSTYSPYVLEQQHYVVSGWAKGNSAKTDYTLLGNSNTYHQPTFALKAVVHYVGTDKITTTYIPFDDENTEWQFVSGTVSSELINGKYYSISSIDVYCCYDYNINTAYFDNISLVKDTNCVTRYSYNDYGYVSNVTGSEGQGVSYGYESNGVDVGQVSSTNGKKLDFEYDDNHRLIHETNTNGTNRFAIDYTYDTYGNIQTTKISSLNQYNHFTINSSVTHSTAAVNFGAVITETDENDRTNRYFYDDKARLTGMCGNDGHGVIYTYNGYGQITRVRGATYSSAKNKMVAAASSASVSSSYDAKGNLSGISTSSAMYQFTYDTYNNLAVIAVNGQTLASYTYAFGNGHVTEMAYGNGYSVEYSYDNVDRMTGICYNNSSTPVFTYTYNANGNLSAHTDTINGKSYMYMYDNSGRMVQKTNKNLSTNEVLGIEQYTYDDQGRVTNVYYNYLDGDTPPLSYCEYTYDTAGNTSKISYGGASGNSNYTFDDFGRLAEEILNKGLSSSSQEILRKQYFYSEDTYPKTTYQVDNLYIVDGQGSEYDTFYEYDSVGNITVIRVEDNGTVIQKYTYEYDRQNCLVRENDYIAASSARSQTVTYTYARSGNITSKKKYAYTEGSLDGLTYRETVYGYAPDIDDPLTMEYADVWNDLMVSYGGLSITYDAIGNPLTYGTYSYTWNGRQLESIYQVSPYVNTTYKYNDEGIRTEKIDNGVRHEYSVSGGQINREVIYSSNGQYVVKDLRYYYDAAGHPSAIRAFTRTSSTAEFTSNIYYLLTNMQGDVIAIYNQDGERIYEYAYDAWGNMLRSVQISTGGRAANQVNPFRYRGYYYDTETGLYYLQSRYYNPQWGRFLNADYAEVISDNGTITDKNLFVYCENNPVMRADADGEFWHIVAGAAIGAVVGGLSSIISQAIAGEDINWTAVAISAASGALSGAINAAFPCMGAIATGVVEGTISAASYAATETLAYGRDVSFGDVLKVGLTSSIMAGGMKGVMQSIGLCNCFIASTLVATETGYVTIENIKAGDLVWATDPETGETTLKPVVQTFRNETTEWIHVTVNGERITCTPEHPFYSPVKGWTSAIDLRAGDILVMLNGEYVVIEQVQHELLETSETTYNFEVKGFHTYYVGIAEILVHNSCRAKNKLKPDSQATEAHTVIKRGANGEITNYATFEPNSKNPTGFDEVFRFDKYGSHGNINGPHVHLPHNKVRAPYPWEFPSS